jgi:transposase-like protein
MLKIQCPRCGKRKESKEIMTDKQFRFKCNDCKFVFVLKPSSTFIRVPSIVFWDEV